MICDDPAQLAATGQSTSLALFVVAIVLIVIGAIVSVRARRGAGVALLLVAVLAGVGLGGGAAPASAANPGCSSSSVGGTVSGLAGTVTITLNGTENLAITSDGSFTFSTPVVSGAGYAVTVTTQPATQTCTVNNATGTAAGTPITTVQVVCTSNSYTVGGTVSGLAGSVMLTLNGSDNLTLVTNGMLTFSTPVVSGGSYSVTVATQPLGQTCTVINGSGIVAGTNITNVQVDCA